jgi:hypothetical protein
MINETLTNFIKQSTQQKGKKRNKEKKPQFDQKSKNQKGPLKGKE